MQKREFDWKLAAAILRAIRDKGETLSEVTADQIKPLDPEWDLDSITYHMVMLVEEGYVVARVIDQTQSPLFCAARRLTMDGLALLKHLENPVFWGAVTREASRKGLDLTLDLIKVIIGAAAERLLKGSS